MSDVNCPNCREPQEINHDDGYGYDEDKTHEQECHHCGETFEFTTEISYEYQVFCKDGQHPEGALEAIGSPRPEYGQCWACNRCDWVGFLGTDNEVQS
ncbi:hypothetical protein [Microbulbifer sp. SAOS-129_SWC]|uniref:hypothetical protein n=1 Tax=Microbulbifer sp. SAOS-129_SWC TaxID=3145235 RepID=UPI003217C6CC